MIPEPVNTPSKRGPRAKDYDDDVQEVISVANALFRCRLSTMNAFPSDALELEWAQISWYEACKVLETKFAATRSIVKIVSCCDA